MLLIGALSLTVLASYLYFASKKNGLHEKEFREFAVLTKRVVSEAHERPCIFLTIGVPTGSLPTGSHVLVRMPDQTSENAVARPYTPTRFHPGCCELMLRVYREGVMSQYLNSLQPGDMVTMRGPTGRHRYMGPGKLAAGKKLYEGIKRIGLLAGGTGITPMLQIVNHILSDVDDNTQVHLLASNSTAADVMLYHQLQSLAERSKGQFILQWTVSKAPNAPWLHLTGRINKSMLLQTLPAPSSDSLICLCGPLAFNKAAKTLLTEIGHDTVITW